MKLFVAIFLQIAVEIVESYYLYNGTECGGIVDFTLNSSTPIQTLELEIQAKLNSATNPFFPSWLNSWCKTSIRQWLCLSAYLEWRNDSSLPDQPCIDSCYFITDGCSDFFSDQQVADLYPLLMDVPTSCSTILYPTTNCVNSRHYSLIGQAVPDGDASDYVVPATYALPAVFSPNDASQCGWQLVPSSSVAIIDSFRSVYTFVEVWPTDCLIRKFELIEILTRIACPFPVYTDKQYDKAEHGLIIISSVSLVISWFVLYQYLPHSMQSFFTQHTLDISLRISPALQIFLVNSCGLGKHRQGSKSETHDIAKFLIFCFSFGAMLMSMAVLIYQASGGREVVCYDQVLYDENSAACVASSILYQFGIGTAVSMAACQSFDLFARVILNMKPINQKNIQKSYKYIAVGYPSFILICGLAGGCFKGDPQWLSLFCTWKYETCTDMFIVIIVAPQLALLAFIAIFLIWIMYHVSNITCKSQSKSWMTMVTVTTVSRTAETATDGNDSKGKDGLTEEIRDDKLVEKIREKRLSPSALMSTMVELMKLNIRPMLLVVLFGGLLLLDTSIWIEAKANLTYYEEEAGKFMLCMFLATAQDPTADVEAGCGILEDRSVPFWRVETVGVVVSSIGLIPFIIYSFWSAYASASKYISTWSQLYSSLNSKRTETKDNSTSDGSKWGTVRSWLAPSNVSVKSTLSSRDGTSENNDGLRPKSVYNL